MSPAWASDFSYAYLRRLLRAGRDVFAMRLLADGPPGPDEPRGLVVRHDVDVALEPALRMGAVEEELGVRATYMVMPASPLYSLGDRSVRSGLRQLVDMGHDIGLHFDPGADPRAERDAGTDTDADTRCGPGLERALEDACRSVEEAAGAAVRSVSFHRPPPALLRGPTRLAGMVNAYSEALMARYLSDSKGSWRAGEPLSALSALAREGDAPVVQVLIHPIWWGERHVMPEERLRELVRARTGGQPASVAQRLEVTLEEVLPGAPRPQSAPRGPFARGAYGGVASPRSGQSAGPAMRALVTGAAGFLGSRLCAALRESGTEVFPLTRAVADLRDRRAVAVALEGRVFDVAFHVAGHIPKSDGEEATCFDANVAGTFNLLEALRSGPPPALVYVSSGSVYGRPSVVPTPESHPPEPLEFYGWSKLAAERLCEHYARHHGLSVAILRPCGIHGPGRTTGVLATWARRALAGEPLVVASPESTKAFVHVDDVAAAGLRAASRLTRAVAHGPTAGPTDGASLPGDGDPAKLATPDGGVSVYNVAPEGEVSLREVAEAVRRASARSVSVEVGDGPRRREAYDVRRAHEELGLVPRPVTATVTDLVRALG